MRDKLVGSNNKIREFQGKHKLSTREKEYIERKLMHMGFLHEKVNQTGDIDEMNLVYAQWGSGLLLSDENLTLPDVATRDSVYSNPADF